MFMLLATGLNVRRVLSPAVVDSLTLSMYSFSDAPSYVFTIMCQAPKAGRSSLLGPVRAEPTHPGAATVVGIAPVIGAVVSVAYPRRADRQGATSRARGFDQSR